MHKDWRCKALGGAHLKPRRNSLEGIWIALVHMYLIILVCWSTPDQCLLHTKRYANVLTNLKSACGRASRKDCRVRQSASDDDLDVWMKLEVRSHLPQYPPIQN